MTDIMLAGRCGHHFDKECDGCNGAQDCTNAEIRSLHAEIARLTAEVDRLSSAVAWYAEPSNWRSPSKGFALQYDPELSPMSKDRGERARTALAAKDQPHG